MSMPVQKPGKSKQNYATPENFMIAITRYLGIEAFAFDFAAEKCNRKGTRFWTEEDNSLSKSSLQWAKQVREGAWGWLNPPYSDINPWAQACKHAKEDGASIAFLVPLSSADWVRDHVFGEALILALNGRLNFMGENWRELYDYKGELFTSEPLYPKDCMCCLFSPHIDPGFDVWDWRRELM